MRMHRVCNCPYAGQRDTDNALHLQGARGDNGRQLKEKWQPVGDLNPCDGTENPETQSHNLLQDNNL
jgi:hypothetical protein